MIRIRSSTGQPNITGGYTQVYDPNSIDKEQKITFNKINPICHKVLGQAGLQDAWASTMIILADQILQE